MKFNLKIITKISSTLKSENFDFLVGEQLIRTNLDIHLKQNFVETDNEIEILVLKRQDAPVPEHSFSAEDWISDVAALGEKVLVASYDGTVALWDAAEEELVFQVSPCRNYFPKLFSERIFPS